MKIQITNLITQEKTLFVNDYSLTENMVSHIMCEQKKLSLLLDEATRKKIKEQYNITESLSTITGNPFAYCEQLDLHAKYIN
jgi:hypothetical protein